MEKSPDAFRTISEVADWLGVPTHVLRFWESRFTQVKPVKRAGGRRYYRPSDMELIGGIKRLLHDDGLTIRGVQKMLREQGVKQVAALSPPLFADDAETVEDKALQFIPRSAPEPEQVQDAEPSDEAEAQDLAGQLPENEAAPEPEPVVTSETAPEPEEVEDAAASAREPEETTASPTDPAEEVDPDDLADLEALDAPPTFRHVARATPEPAPARAEDNSAAGDGQDAEDAGDLLDLMQSKPVTRKPAPFIVEEDDAEGEEDDDDAPAEPNLSVSSRLRFVDSFEPGADTDRLRIALDRARALRDSMASRHAE